MAKAAEKSGGEVIDLNKLKKMKPQELARYAAKLDIEGRCRHA